VLLKGAEVVRSQKMTLGSAISETTKSAERQHFRRLLLRWFDLHKRDLPWRQDRDPYRIWLSEIMLQQTRVNAVTDYYEKFLLRFPTIETLASANESAVLAAWSGLGYYRRARMLHAAAKTIVSEYNGELPKTAEGLRALPGIGRYTAAAIASIAFNQPIAVVDGNVERVLQRVHGRNFAGEALWQAATELLAPRRPGDFNQAMMELGATVCLAQQPRCLLCPVSKLCATRGKLRVAGKGIRQTKREIHYAFASRNDSIFLVRRSKSATLMPGMWEFPETIGNGIPAWLTLRHSITVTDYRVQVVRDLPPAGLTGRWVSKPQLTDLPLTGLARKILRAAKVI
jgi:A/G-specific adenine glycosylase